MKLTVPEVASLLGAEVPQVYDWIEDGGLPAQRIGGQYLINRTELLEWTTGREVTLAPTAFAHTMAGSSEDSLASALRDGSIAYAVPANDEAAVVRAIVNSFDLAEGDRETLAAFMLGREALGLAIVGDRIAMPQVRTPAVLPLRDKVEGKSSSRLSLLFLEHPVKLGDAARVVETILFVVAPTVRAHLSLLAKLAWSLDDERFRAVLRSRSDRASIVAAAAAAEDRL